MAKASGARPAGGGRSRRGGRTTAVEPQARPGPTEDRGARFEAVMRAAEQSGLLGAKSGRIAGRVSEALVRQAKRQTGIVTDSELLEFALAAVALEDDFAEAFRKSRGKVDPELTLGY